MQITLHLNNTSLYSPVRILHLNDKKNALLWLKHRQNLQNLRCVVPNYIEIDKFHSKILELILGRVLATEITVKHSEWIRYIYGSHEKPGHQGLLPGRAQTSLLSC